MNIVLNQGNNSFQVTEKRGRGMQIDVQSNV
jgi:hypothetical protein